MALRIRLQRHGRKRQPFYRIVVQDREAPRDGRHVEIVGFYNPLPDPPVVRVKKDRVLYWLGKGAEPTETVASLLRREGIQPYAGARAGG
jgi:small subunit ribosomal protein S16